MKSAMFMRTAGALLALGLALPASGAFAKGEKPGAAAAADTGNGAGGEAREGRKKHPLGYAEYVRLVSRGGAVRHAGGKHRGAKVARSTVKAPEKGTHVASAPVAAAAPVAAPPAVTPRPRGRDWRPAPDEVREILHAGRDLRGAVLRGMNLAGVDLRGAVLAGADLFGANLDGANLEGANLRGASLEMASLRGASLRGAKLEGAGLFKANLEGANLAGADLTGVYAVCANLRGAVLASATVRGGVFTNAAVGTAAGGVNVATAFTGGGGTRLVGTVAAAREVDRLPAAGQVALLTF